MEAEGKRKELRLPDDLTRAWPLWRLVEAGWVTMDRMHDLSLPEVLDANDVLDALDAARAEPAK